MNLNRCWLSELRKWEARKAWNVVKMLRKGVPVENRWLEIALV